VYTIVAGKRTINTD